MDNRKKRADLEAKFREIAEDMLAKKRHKTKMVRYEFLKEELNSRDRTYENKNVYVESTIEDLIKYFDNQFHPNT